MLIAIVVTFAAALFVWFSGESLPATVASHFNAAGMADGFQSREDYLRMMVMLVILVPLGIAFLGRILPLLPASLINLPNKQYWLAPQRKEETMGYFAKWMTWLAAGIAIFLGYVHWLVVRGNAATPPSMDATLMWGGLGVFLVLTVAWTAMLYRRFGGRVG